MDPDATLSIALGVARAVADGRSAGPDDARDLADALLNLDEWIARGGYLPARWRSAAPARPRGAALAEELDRTLAERGYQEARELRAAGDLEGAKDAQDVALRRDPDNRP
jgi:hypothetical protein